MTDTIGDLVQNAESDPDGFFERPVLPLNNVVIYPQIMTPVSFRENTTLQATQAAHQTNQTIICVTRTDPAEDIIGIGTEAAINGRIIKLPNGYHSALMEGRRRVEIVAVVQREPYIIVRAREIPTAQYDPDTVALYQHSMIDSFGQIIDLTEGIPDDVYEYATNNDDPFWLGDFLASTLSLPLEDQVQALEITDLEERLRFINTLLTCELNMLELKDEINGQIQQEIARNQREIYLREQMRVIQGELGEDDIFQQDILDLEEQIAVADLPEEAFDKAIKELSRLKMMPPVAPEVGIIRNYLDWMLSLPWSNQSEDNLDVLRAQQVLDDEHHGLPKVKDRILEHIAVRKLAQDKMKSPILCFVGPPGVGKTSLGQSIAKALGREFVRVSLGGMRDEAEIRGHRRTYIGALPGRILQTMQRAGTTNPVFMLDEIDKIGNDFRGDPAAALLEALDPEQNKDFSDHYLELPYDLSQVMFVTTANDLYPLPDALLDRMEVIEFPGYTEEDKLAIARSFLIPKQLEAHGLSESGIQFETGALQTIVREYTYEAGVRNLNREIGTVCRKVARRVAEGKRYPKRITGKHIGDYLGPPQFLALRANDKDSVGVATGLAWTAGGGDTMTIEASLLAGKGSLTLTGQLGDIMQESAQAALSYMRSRAKDLDVPYDDFENYDVHIHLPEGAVPKDGPSAGITLASAIISIFTERPIRSDYAMTGEITLRGRVLPVGGIREKLLAAHRARIFNIILPEQNRKDLVDLPAKALRDLNITYVENMQQVMDTVLLPAPEAGRERDNDETEADSS